MGFLRREATLPLTRKGLLEGGGNGVRMERPLVCGRKGCYALEGLRTYGQFFPSLEDQKLKKTMPNCRWSEGVLCHAD